MKITIPLFDGFTAIDAVGPYEVLWRLRDAEVVFAASTRGLVEDDNRSLALRAEQSLEEAAGCDVLLVPGGLGTRSLAEDEQWPDWLRSTHAGTRMTASVCTGSLLLAAAGLLDGVEATTHWRAMPELARLGAIPVQRRVVRAGRIFTSAGATAGIDLALIIAAELGGVEAAQEIQLAIEYDPEPPFDAGSPAKAPAALVERLSKRGADSAAS